jgi:hypothetical protein
MYGLSAQSKDQIDRVVRDLFDKAALRFIGIVPKLQQKKMMLIGFEQNIGLANLFVQSMNNRWLNNVENEVLRSVLSGAASYIDILKNKTSSNIIQRIEGLAREARIGNDKIPEHELNKVIEEEFGRARSGLEAIAASESTKARNLGMTMDISRAAAADGDKDPVVGFAVIRDASTCPICVKLNLMPDGVTPKLYRLSELSAGYYKRGEQFPSILGQHPHCRCTIFYVPEDWGFDKKGHITFKSIGYNALKEQREAA